MSSFRCSEQVPLFDRVVTVWLHEGDKCPLGGLWFKQTDGGKIWVSKEELLKRRTD